MNKKLKAYTVIELIVVMLISGVTITIAYRGFDIFNNLFSSFRKNGMYISNIAFFNRVLSEDMLKSNYVYKTDDGIVCVSNDKKSTYIFNDDHIIRQEIKPDTFFIKPSGVTCYFLKEEQLETGALIDRVSIVSYNVEDTLYFNNEKLYGADVLMEREKKTNSYDN